MIGLFITLFVGSLVPAMFVLIGVLKWWSARNEDGSLNVKNAALAISTIAIAFAMQSLMIVTLVMSGLQQILLQATGAQ